MVLVPSAISAQSSQSVSSQSVPRLINVTGVFRPPTGSRPAPSRPSRSRSTPMRRAARRCGRRRRPSRSMRQGRTRCCSAQPVPTGSRRGVRGGAAHWLGTVFERPGEVEGPRTRLTSVPYALRASDADTLGGRPASAYLLAAGAGGTTHARDAAEAGASEPISCCPGRPTFSPST